MGDVGTERRWGWDSHMHLVPPAVVAAAREGAFGLAVEGQKLRVGDARVPLGRIVDVSALVARLDADGLEGGLVAVPPGLFRASQPDRERRDWAELVNNGLAELLASHPSRLRGMAFLPIEDPWLAAELADGLDERWAGVTFGTELNGRRLHQPEYDELWQVLSRRRLPVLLHPGHPPDPRLDEFYLTNLLGYPVETTVAAAHLVFGGVLDRHPDLVVLLSHGGAAVATLAGRWDRGAATKRPGVPQLPRAPLDYVRRFYVDTVTHSPAYIDFLVEALGADRLLLGSDWPFPMGTDAAEDCIGHLPPHLLEAVRSRNVSRIFNMTAC